MSKLSELQETIRRRMAQAPVESEQQSVTYAPSVVGQEQPDGQNSALAQRMMRAQEPSVNTQTPSPLPNGDGSGGRTAIGYQPDSTLQQALLRRITQSPPPSQESAASGVGQPPAPYVDRDDSYLDDKQKQDLVWGNRPPVVPLSARMQEELKKYPDNSAQSPQNRVQADGTLAPVPDSTQRATAQVSSRLAHHEERINGLLDQLDALENNPAHPRHGRVVSSLIGALQGLARGGIGGAIVGGVIGLASPKMIQRIQDHAKALKLRGRIDESLKLEKTITDIQHVQSETDKNIAAPGAAADKEKREADEKLHKELVDQIHFAMNTRYPKGYKPGSDQTLDAMIRTAGIYVPPPAEGGGGMNPELIKSVGGFLVYVHSDRSGNPYYETIKGKDGKEIPMTEEDKRKFNLDLARENRQRAEDGLKPIIFAGDVKKPVAPVEKRDDLAPEGEAEEQNQGWINPAGDVDRVGPEPSELVLSGAPVPKIQSQFQRGGGGGGRRGGAPATESGGSVYDNAAVQKIIDNVSFLKSQAAQSKDPAKRKALLDEANGLVESAKRNPNTKNIVEAGGASDGSLFWPSINFKGGSSPAPQRQSTPTPSRIIFGGGQSQPSANSQPYAGRTISTENLRKYARDHKKTLKDAARELQSQGVTVQ